ncbi:MAG: flagellar hook-length control protein FliK [Gammaproteobacteria bacterium]|nr:hypothetical protein [Sideroxydans sp.]MBU3903602.1 flagellar hook-length control protein FliK [Gammaproteobacteria bacterium]MBU4046143.1 flagellar hook-length control protein FliK [Gammaproteobacteria bacterium]MBU4150883.1 flagellar hook-length control protein FliK [Gammaproteobacteria bacterium]
MSSLPILSSQTPSNGKIDAGKPGNNTPSAEDSANGSAPFGELLAKQLSPHGRDIKNAIVKNSALADSDKLVVDPSLLSNQAAAEIRTDGVALPVDFLASLLPQEKRAALTSSKDTPVAARDTDASEEMESLDSAARRIGPTIDGEVKPDARLTNTVSDKQANGRDDRGSSEIKQGTAFAALLQAEDKAGIRTTAGKVDSALPVQTMNTSAGVIGMPNTLTAPASQPTQVTVATPMNQPQWSDDFSQKVTWLATQRMQSAELRLNPAQLGPLEVSLKLNGDQATMQFTSAHAGVREAIEQSIPRLRDMLADSGISLGSATVSDQAQKEQQRQGQAGGANGNGTGNTDNSLESDTPQVQATTILRRHDGVVDTFA